VQQLADDFPERFARLHVHAHGGFIEEQQFGTAADGERELHLPLLPTRQLAVRPVRDFTQLQA
jgi:hypothetical protein